MDMATTKWKIAKSARRCNTFPAVWAAIVGCTGSGKAFRYRPGLYYRETEFACEACRAAQDASSALVGQAHQDHLRALQDAAGVADYRIAEVRTENGRPILTGRIDRDLAGEALRDALYNWTAGCGAISRCIELIRIIGGDCGPEVRAVCTARQREQLATAYRAAVRAAR